MWPLYVGFYRGPTVLWAFKIAVGLLALAGVVTAWRRRRSTHVGHLVKWPLRGVSWSGAVRSRVGQRLYSGSSEVERRPKQCSKVHLT